MHKLVVLRHGQSQWNKENRFTGWHDVDLSSQGVQEAHQAGKTLKDAGYVFDEAHTNVLTRCIRTLWIALDELNLMWIPVYKTWRLNERHYGGLTGLNKTETVQKHGEEQVKIWRRSYDVPPPPMEKTHEFWMGDDPRYSTLDKKEFPVVECLKDVVARFLPYWEGELTPKIKSGKKILLSLSGNSSRALIQYLDQMSNEDIINFQMPTGIPLVYELDDDLKPLKRYFLGDPEEVKKAQEVVANQIKMK